MYKVKCEICGNEFFVCNINQHKVRHFNGNYEKSLKTRHVTHDGLNCIYCGKECKNKNSLAQHEIRCKCNPDRIKANDNIEGKCSIPINKRGWSKGLTKDTDQRVMNSVLAVKKYYESHDGTFKGKSHTEEWKKNISQLAIENNYQSHFGVHKSYEYKGIKFISSYEVSVAKELDINNIKWLKPKHGTFKYKDLNDKVHTYTPDFYLPDYNIYLDPKNDFLINHINPTLGYSDLDKINWVMQQNNVVILILDKNNLTWENISKIIGALGERLIPPPC